MKYIQSRTHDDIFLNSWKKRRYFWFFGVTSAATIPLSHGAPGSPPQSGARTKPGNASILVIGIEGGNQDVPKCLGGNRFVKAVAESARIAFRDGDKHTCRRMKMGEIGFFFGRDHAVTDDDMHGRGFERTEHVEI